MGAFDEMFQPVAIIPGMPVKPGDVLWLPIEYDGGLDLWCFRVETSWDLGTERGWRIGWYSNEDGVPTSLVATTWVAEPVERLDFWSR